MLQHVQEQASIAEIQYALVSFEYVSSARGWASFGELRKIEGEKKWKVKNSNKGQQEG